MSEAITLSYWFGDRSNPAPVAESQEQIEELRGATSSTANNLDNVTTSGPGPPSDIAIGIQEAEMMPMTGEDEPVTAIVQAKAVSGKEAESQKWIPQDQAHAGQRQAPLAVIIVDHIKYQTLPRPRSGDQKIGSCITSSFLQLHQITSRSKRTDFDHKWGSKQVKGTVLQRQTDLLGVAAADSTRYAAHSSTFHSYPMSCLPGTCGLGSRSAN